jgi:hypothetical protein
MTQKTEITTTLHNCTVAAIQKVASEDNTHFSINMFDKDNSLIDSFSYTSETAANQYAASYGATKFDDKGWWRAPKL